MIQVSGEDRRGLAPILAELLVREAAEAGGVACARLLEVGCARMKNGHVRVDGLVAAVENDTGCRDDRQECQNGKHETCDGTCPQVLSVR